MPELKIRFRCHAPAAAASLSCLQAYNRDLFMFLFICLTAAAFGSSLQQFKIPLLLNRPQTEEWKGWMQVGGWLAAWCNGWLLRVAGAGVGHSRVGKPVDHPPIHHHCNLGPGKRKSYHYMFSNVRNTVL